MLFSQEFVLEAVENVLKSLYPDPVTMSICKPDAESKDINTNYIESQNEDRNENINTENEDREKQNLSLSPEKKDQPSSHDYSPKPDLEQGARKEYSVAHATSSLSEESDYSSIGKQKDAEVSSYGASHTPEIQVLNNTASSDDLPITDDAWSRGNAFRNSTGEDIPPVMVLCPSAVSHGAEKSNETALDKSHNVNTDQKTTNRITEKSGFVTAFDLMNNRVIRKPATAIDIFTQEHKVKLLNDSPQVPFDVIPSVILELWEKLSEEDKLR